MFPLLSIPHRNREGETCPSGLGRGNMLLGVVVGSG